MHPFQKRSTGVPACVSSHLDVRLKSGWRYESRRRALVSEDGAVVSLRGVLPSGARVVPMAPGLAKADARGLTDDERLLACCVQVVLPPEADASGLAPALRRLDVVEQVSTPPRIGLP